MKLKVGDSVYSKRFDVERIITEVRETGYTWRYPESKKGVDYWSEDSEDPFFDGGWVLK